MSDIDKNKQTPLEKFVRLATARSDKAVHELKLLRNLAASAYQIDSTLAQTIVEKLEKDLNELKVKWKLVPGSESKRRRKSESSEGAEESDGEKTGSSVLAALAQADED